MPESFAYVIVGAGVFGASTALELITRCPLANVTLIDVSFPCRAAASWDWSKVVRADYSNITYMRLALEAMKEWRSNPLYQPFYHQSGMIWVDDRPYPKLVMENYKKLGVDVDATLLSPEETKTLCGGLYANADFGDATEILVNKDCGWAEASLALETVIKSAIAAGVKTVEAEIAQLEMNKQTCVGVRCSDGRLFTADRVILATGARTAKLLLNSFPNDKEFQVGHRLTAAALYTGFATIETAAAAQFRGGHIFFHAVGESQGAGLPIDGDNKIKLGRDVSFRNTTQHANGEQISLPPDGPEYNQWELSPRMKRELTRVGKGIYGQEFQPDNCRICWDAMTPTHDFLICAHPHVQGLYLATGGSFHAWKFLPCLGQYVADMLEEVLSSELVAKWAWDREETAEQTHTILMPVAELVDML